MNFGFILYDSASLKIMKIYYRLLSYLIITTVLLFLFCFFKNSSSVILRLTNRGLSELSLTVFTYLLY